MDELVLEPAWFIQQMTDGWRGDARLYRTTKGYVVVSICDDAVFGRQGMVMATDGSGECDDFGDVVIEADPESHEALLKMVGYRPEVIV